MLNASNISCYWSSVLLPSLQLVELELGVQISYPQLLFQLHSLLLTHFKAMHSLK